MSSCYDGLDYHHSGRHQPDSADRRNRLKPQEVKSQIFQKGVIAAIPPLGYDFGNGSELVLNPIDAEIVRYIFDMYLIVQSLSDVARLCSTHGFTGRRGKPFTPFSISTILRNPVYCGYEVFNGHFKPVKTPVIIPLEDFDEVQQLMAFKNAYGGRKRRKTTIRINEKGE